LFSPGIDHHFGIEYRAQKLKSDKVYHTERTNKRVWDAINWETYGRPTRRSYGQLHNDLAFSQSFGIRAYIMMYGAIDSIPNEDVRDDLYGVMHRIIPRMGGGFARAFATNEELVCAEFFSNGGYTSGTGLNTFDGVSLFSTAHPVSESQPTITISNRPSADADIAISTADAARTALVSQYAENNIEILDISPRLFVCNESQARIARQVWHAPWERGTADRNENIIADYGVEVMEWPYFTKSGATGTNNAWFLLGDVHHLYKIVREDLYVDSDKDISTGSYLVTADARFAVAASNWRGSYGSTGS
jgi:hypothetical protein